MFELIILVSITLPFLCISVMSIVSSFQLESVSQVVRIFTQKELELAKKYAAIFGLDNEAHDINVEELIEMGRKYEEYLGTETIDRIAEQHVAFYRGTMKSNMAKRITARSHYVSRVVRKRNILAHITCLAHNIFTKTICGGNKDGEPNSSLH